MNWHGKNVLVTGAGGFIGSHLVEALVHHGASVRALVHYNALNSIGNLRFLPADVLDAVEIVSGDVTDSGSLEHAVAGTAYVFHLAALIAIPYSYRAPQSYICTNILGTTNVLREAMRADVHKIVHTSTSETYGTAQYTPIDEQHPLQGQSPYSASKIGADKIAESFFCSFGTPVATVRPFNTYGPRQSQRAIIPTIISQMLWNEQVRLGLLSPIRDFTFVKDTVAGFLAVAESEKAIGRVINIGSGNGISVSSLCAKISTLLKIEKPVVEEEERLRPKTSEVYELLCNAEVAATLCGWKPQTSLDEGLRQTIAFMRAHPDADSTTNRFVL